LLRRHLVGRQLRCLRRILLLSLRLRDHRLLWRSIFVAVSRFVLVIVCIGCDRGALRLRGESACGCGRRRLRASLPSDENETMDSVGLLRRAHHDVIKTRSTQERCDNLSRLAGSEMNDHAITGTCWTFDGGSGCTSDTAENIAQRGVRCIDG